MNITLHTQPAPAIDPHILASLQAQDPRIFLIWQPRFKHLKQLGDIWEGRWEIWIELRHVPGARNTRARGDRWNTDAQCWMRRLQTYTHADGSFAPADERLLIGLALAETWNNREFYRKHIDEASELQDKARLAPFRDAAAGSSRYYRQLDSTSVGAYVNSGWRHRIR